MAKYDVAGLQYEDDAGNPLISGELYFYDSGTTTPKTTYSDIDETIAQTHPIVLPANGRAPDIYFTGSARLIIKDSGGTTLVDKDPVVPTGAGGNVTSFDAWNAVTTYAVGNLVTGSDGRYYRLISGTSQGDDPTSTSGIWAEVFLVEDYEAGRTYLTNQIVTYTDNNLYISLQDSNTGNTPDSSPLYWKVLTAAGNTTGPGSSTDNALVRFDGTGGTTFQNSLLIVDDSGNVTGVTIDGRDVGTDGTKLDGIEAGADVTDATNVNAAGAVMLTDTDATTFSFTSTDSNPAAPTNQELWGVLAAKTYMDNLVISAGSVVISGTPSANQMTRWTAANTIEGITDLVAAQTILSGTSFTSVTPALTDKIILQDADDSDNVKTATASDILDLMPYDIQPETRTSNTIFAAADNAKLIDYTTGSFTQTFTAAATLGDGWHIYLRNLSADDVTLDPNASETIDGLTSGVIKPGMAILVACDGSNFSAVRVGPATTMEVLTAGTSWTAPLGVRSVKVTLVGGGGGGGSGTGSGGGAYSGGGSGASITARFPVVPGTAYTYAIGAGGAGGTYGPADGSAGGNTTFEINVTNTLTAGGGAGGGNAANAAGGTATGAPDFVELASNGNIGSGGGSTFGSGAPRGGVSILGASYGTGGTAGVTTGNGQPGTTGAIILEY